MNVLFIKFHSLYQKTPDERDEFISAVDAWRIQRPAEILRKHTDWNIDVKGEWIPLDLKINDPKLNKYVDELGKKYDIIYSSYTRQGMQYAIIDYLIRNHGVKYVMDIDDDLFNQPKWNPTYETFARKGGIGRLFTEEIVKMVPNLTVTTKPLAKEYRRLRNDHDKETVTVIPNYASKEFYDHPGTDNGMVEVDSVIAGVKKKVPKVVIGWHGSMHHKGDLAMVWPVIERIMEENPHVYLHTVAEIPKGKFDPNRVKVFNAKRGMDNWKRIYRTLDFDIGIAPLEETTFNRGKSNIKWQEYALMGAAPVCSQVYPYLRSVEDGKTGVLCGTTEDWYEKLTKLVIDHDYRKKIAKGAKEEVEKNWLLENNWTVYRDYFQELAA